MALENQSFVLSSEMTTVFIVAGVDGMITVFIVAGVDGISSAARFGGSTRGLTRRGDWRSLFCSITELPQTKVEAERTDPEAGGEEEVREKTEPEAGEDRKSRRLEFFFF
ncbi:hypothetical protein Bca4012_089929 [Brassica carinata]